MIKPQQMKVGDKVTYQPAHGFPEKGRIKEITPDERVFVVYHCGGDWADFQNYTGALTSASDLYEGWYDGTTDIYS